MDHEIAVESFLVDAVDNPAKVKKVIQHNPKSFEDLPVELRLDKDGAILYANPAGELLLQSWGCKMGDPIQAGTLSVYVPRLLQDVSYEVFMGQLSKSIEIEANNKVYWFFVVNVPDSNYVNIFGTDITERKKAEGNLKRLAKNYRKLFDEFADAIFVSDLATGVIFDCNQAATKLIGLPRSKIVGMHQRLLHPSGEDISEFNRILELHQINSKGTTFEAPVITKEGEIRYAEIRVEIIDVNGRKMLQSIFRDKTEEKQLKSQLTKLTYKISDFAPGGCFIAESNENCFRAYTDLTFNGTPGLCIAREDPEKLIKEYGIKREKIKLLSLKPFKDFEVVRDLQAVSLSVSWFLKANKSGVVLIDGLEYLITRFGFEAVYSFIQEKRFDFLECGAVLLLSANMGVLTEKEKALLISETKAVCKKSDFPSTA